MDEFGSLSPFQNQEFLLFELDDLPLPEKLPSVTPQESFHLYSCDRKDEILKTDAYPRYFMKIPGSKFYSNLFVDTSSNQICLIPCTPWHMLQSYEFEDFLKTYETDVFIVVRIGFEVHFGPVDNLSELETEIIRCLSHHIYDTAAIVDVHDFHNKTRRVRTFCVRKAGDEKGNAILFWKKGYLGELNH